MKVYILTREDGHYYGSYEVYKVVRTESEAKELIKGTENRYEEFEVE